MEIEVPSFIFFVENWKEQEGVSYQGSFLAVVAYLKIQCYLAKFTAFFVTFFYEFLISVVSCFILIFQEKSYAVSYNRSNRSTV